MIQRIIKLLVQEEIEKQANEVIDRVNRELAPMQKLNTEWHEDIKNKYLGTLEKIDKHNKIVEGWLRLFMAKSGVEVPSTEEQPERNNDI